MCARILSIILMISLSTASFANCETHYSEVFHGDAIDDDDYRNDLWFTGWSPENSAVGLSLLIGLSIASDSADNGNSEGALFAILGVVTAIGLTYLTAHLVYKQKLKRKKMVYAAIIDLMDADPDFSVIVKIREHFKGSAKKYERYKDRFYKIFERKNKKARLSREGVMNRLEYLNQNDLICKPFKSRKKDGVRNLLGVKEVAKLILDDSIYPESL